MIWRGICLGFDERTLEHKIIDIQMKKIFVQNEVFLESHNKIMVDLNDLLLVKQTPIPPIKPNNWASINGAFAKRKINIDERD